METRYEQQPIELLGIRMWICAGGFVCWTFGVDCESVE